MSFKQFKSAEFQHYYFRGPFPYFRSYWTQIDIAHARMRALRWKINIIEADTIARDLDLLGEATETWKDNETAALNHVYNKDAGKADNDLSNQLKRLREVLTKLQDVFPDKHDRLSYTLGWLQYKHDAIYALYKRSTEQPRNP